MRNIFLAAAFLVGISQISAAYAQVKVYVINEDVVRRDSKIGKDIAAKLGEARQAGVTQLGLTALQTQIQTEDAALKPQTQALTVESLNANPTLKARVEALNRLKSEYVQKADALNNALDQQSSAATVAFAAALEPAVEFAAKEAGADLVLSYSSTWYVKPTADLSAKVIARLDATTPTLAALQAAAPKPPGGS